MAPGSVGIEDVESLDALAGEWQALAAAHGTGVPFLTWEWVSAWQARFMERRFLVRDRPLFQAVRDPAGRLVAVAPLMITHRPAVGSLFRVVDFLGTDPNVTELRGMLCDPAWEGAAVRALFDRLMQRRGEWDWMHLRGLRVGGQGHGLLESLPGVTWDRETPAHVLPLPESWEVLRAGVSRNLKESLRHGYNSLRKDGISFEVTVAREPSEVCAALESFFDLHRARAELEGTVSHGNVFASAMAREFLLDVCGRLCRRDMVRVFAMRIAGEVVATRVAFALGDTLYLYFSGYLPAWKKYGVMTTTVAEAVRYAIANGFRSVHLSTGTDTSKTRWRPATTLFRDAVVTSPSLRGRLAHRWMASVRPTLSSSRLRRLLGRSHHSC